MNLSPVVPLTSDIGSKRTLSRNTGYFTVRTPCTIRKWTMRRNALPSIGPMRSFVYPLFVEEWVSRLCTEDVAQWRSSIHHVHNDFDKQRRQFGFAELPPLLVKID